MRARTRGARCARTGCARRARGCARCACTWGMAEQGGCTGRVHMRAQEGCARTGPQGRDVHEVADAVTNAYENLARQSKTPCSWWLKGDPVQGSLRWGRMRYGRRIRRTLAQPVRTCLAAVMLQRPFVQVPHIFAALCAEKSCPPSPDGVGDGAWMAGGCQHSCLLSGARAEIYLTWTDGGACATSASVEDFAAKSAHATWFQVYTTGTVRVRSNRGVATKKAAQP